MEQLKVGDWVKIPEDRNGRSLSQIKELYPDNSMKAKLYWPSEESTSTCMQMQHYAKWNPEPGEWCWFWDYLGFTPTIGIYVGRSKENFLADIPNGKGSLSLMSFKYCQPFIGESPSELKDL